MRNITLCLIFVLLGACTNYHWNWGGGKPTSLDMKNGPDGPPIYKQAYRDGCQSGYSGYANAWNKVWYSFKQDPQLAQNPVYYQMWKDAYAYCANYGMMSDINTTGNWR